MEPQPDPEVERDHLPAVTRRAVLSAGLTGISGVALAGCSTPAGSGTGASGAGHGAQSASPSPSSGTTSGATGAGSGGTSDPHGAPRLALTAGPDITRGSTSRRQVALTFHGQGPVSMAREILTACASADAAITVFAVGTWLTQNPHIGAEIVAAGHEVGNHTWSHQQMKQLSAKQAVDEAVRGAKALKAAVGSAGWWFRPSGTQHSTPTIRAAAAAAGYHRCVSYDVDPEDFRDPGARLVRDRTLKAVLPGSIVSLHFGHRGTVDALPAILAGLHSKGLQPVTLSTLLRGL